MQVENELNELSKKVERIPTKELTKDLINTYSIFKSYKIFFFKYITKLHSTSVSQ